jgi:XTP/dITP diphosphohydrolase
MREFDGDTLILATHNAGKVREIGAMLAPFNVAVKSAGELNLPEPEETETTFIGNAKLKALAAATAAGIPALADDSGLCVNGLNGDPGIYSARWAGPGKDFGVAMDKVNTALGDNPDRSAFFMCALALAWPDGHCETFAGRIDGALVWPARGLNGFGYDPIFVPDGFAVTFGEMDPDAKHAMSHRARAFAQFVAGCFA